MTLGPDALPGSGERGASYYPSQKYIIVKYAPHWLASTAPEYTGYVLLRSLGLDLQEFPGGRYGYTNRAEAWGGDICVYWHRERVDMGSHIVVRGGGFERMEQEGQDAHGFVVYLHDNGCRETRLDLAWDDRRGLIPLSAVEEKWKRGEYTSLPGPRPQAGIQHIAGKTGDAIREAFYFPSLTSKTGFVRVYDKRLERVASGHDDPGPWVRIELSAKHERAQQAASWYIQGDDAALAALTRRYVEFREPSDDAFHKCRWPLAPWWAAYWQGLGDGIDTTLAPDGRSAEEKAAARLEWERDTVLPVVARRFLRNGGDLGDLLSELRVGLEKDMLRHPEAYSQGERERIREGGLEAWMTDATTARG